MVLKNRAGQVVNAAVLSKAAMDFILTLFKTDAIHHLNAKQLTLLSFIFLAGSAGFVYSMVNFNHEQTLESSAYAAASGASLYELGKHIMFAFANKNIRQEQANRAEEVISLFDDKPKSSTFSHI